MADTEGRKRGDRYVNPSKIGIVKGRCNNCGRTIRGLTKTICDDCRCPVCRRVEMLCECPKEKK